jgi:hypothetical protein
MATLKIGDVVKHKVMKGKFIIVGEAWGGNMLNTRTGWEIRREDGQKFLVKDCELK